MHIAMRITCSQCQKKLTVSEASAGKKVRCPGCKGVVVVPKPKVSDGDATVVEDTALIQPAMLKSSARSKKPARPGNGFDTDKDAPAAKKLPRKAPVADDENAGDDQEDDAPADAQRCARCKSAAIEPLPPNNFSRRPGFVCKKCGAKMRPPGSTVAYLFAIFMGVFGICFGIGMVILYFVVENTKLRIVSGGAVIAVASVSLIGWAFNQMRLPVPLNAPPVRWLLWISVSLVVLVLVAIIAGGCLFAFAYFLHEM